MDRKTRAFNEVARELLCAERREEGIWSRPAYYREQHTFGTVPIEVPGVGMVGPREGEQG